MSRSGYVEDWDEQWQLIMYRGAVASAIRGARGQAFLRELREALDKLPERKLIKNELAEGDAVCALGAVGRARGLDMTKLAPEDAEQIAAVFGIATALAREVVFLNDEAGYGETPEQRFESMRAWAEGAIRPAKPGAHP